MLACNGLFFVSVAEERGGFAEDGGTVIDVVPIFSMHCQAAFEIGKIFLLGIRPQHLSQGRHAGHHHIFHVVWGKDVLCPNVGLGTQNVAM